MPPPAVVEQFDIFEHLVAGVSSSTPPAPIDQFDFERGEKTFRHCVVPAIAFTAHAALDAVDRELLLIFVAGVLGEFKRLSQQLGRGSCDDYAKAPFRSMRASSIAVAGPTSGSTAGELSAVLGIDCGRLFNRGRCYRRRSIARGGWPVVPEGRRHDTLLCFAVFKAPVGSLSSVC